MTVQQELAQVRGQNFYVCLHDINPGDGGVLIVKLKVLFLKVLVLL
jgi:hypothetical protein